MRSAASTGRITTGRLRVWRVVRPDVRANPGGQHAARRGCARRLQPAGLRLADCECGAWSDLTFGQIRAGSTRRVADALGGYNRQDYDWQLAAQVQHQLRPNVALNAGYFRTWYGNFLVTDNQATTVNDYDPYCVTAPSDSRLPGGGGNQICGLYDIKPAVFGRVDNVVTQHTHYGKQKEVFNGVDVGLEARLARGARFQAGVSVGRTMTDTCDLNSLPQVLANTIAGTAVSTSV